MWGQKLGLERIRDLLAALGSPHLARPTVLVAGTNGKGSVTALLGAILRHSGLRVGTYFSPHLETVEERIRIDGRTIAGERLGEHLRTIVEQPTPSGEPPTYFEAMTAAALLEFARQQVDLAVLEVGLGGRLDATNVCEPVLSLITGIAIDHEEHLGSRTAQIAGEKAGIMRRDRPVLVCSGLDPEVRAALDQRAAEIGSRLEDVSETVSVEILASGRQRLELQLGTPRRGWRLDSALTGEHQAGNVALAVRAAEVLDDLGFGPVPEAAVVEATRSLRWPGRLEQVELPAGATAAPTTLLLDGAHNPAGGRSLAAHLRLLRAEGLAAAEAATAESMEIVLLFGTLAGKRAEETLEALLPQVDRAVLTEPPGGPRTLPLDRLSELAAPLWTRRRGLDGEADWRRALQLALEPGEDAAVASTAGAATKPRLVVVAGSLYLVGAVRAEARARFQVPPATVDLVV